MLQHFLPLFILVALGSSEPNIQCPESEEQYEIIQYRWTIDKFTSIRNEVQNMVHSPEFPSKRNSKSTWDLRMFSRRNILGLGLCITGDSDKAELANYQFYILHNDFVSSGNYFTGTKERNIFSLMIGNVCHYYQQYLIDSEMNKFITSSGNIDVVVHVERFLGAKDCHQVLEHKTSNLTVENFVGITADHCTTDQKEVIETFQYMWIDKLSNNENEDFQLISPIIPSPLQSRFHWRMVLQKESKPEKVQLGLYLAKLQNETFPVIVAKNFSIASFAPSQPEKIISFDSVHTVKQNTWGANVTTFAAFKQYYTNSSGYFRINSSFVVSKYNIECNAVSPLTNFEPYKGFYKIVALQENVTSLNNSKNQLEISNREMLTENIDLKKKLESETRKNNATKVSRDQLEEVRKIFDTQSKLLRRRNVQLEEQSIQNHKLNRQLTVKTRRVLELESRMKMERKLLDDYLHIEVPPYWNETITEETNFWILWMNVSSSLNKTFKADGDMLFTKDNLVSLVASNKIAFSSDETESTAISLLELAETANLPTLKPAIENILIQLLNSENALKLHDAAQKTNSKNLMETATDFIKATDGGNMEKTFYDTVRNRNSKSGKH